MKATLALVLMGFSLFAGAGCASMATEADRTPSHYGWPEPDTGASHLFGDKRDV